MGDHTRPGSSGLRLTIPNDKREAKNTDGSADSCLTPETCFTLVRNVESREETFGGCHVTCHALIGEVRKIIRCIMSTGGQRDVVTTERLSVEPLWSGTVGDRVGHAPCDREVSVRLSGAPRSLILHIRLIADLAMLFATLVAGLL